MNPRVSFVIPTYNRDAWLAETISGLLAQTVEEIEVIVVDDGSTDTTQELLDGWGSKFSRLKVIYNDKNLGAGASRNIGMDAAQAPIVAVCDSDDVYATEYAELIVKHFDLNPKSELVNFPYISIGYCNERLEEFEGMPFDHDLFLKDGKVTYFANPASAHRKESAKEIGGYPNETEKETDDIQFLRKWVGAGKKVDFQPGFFPCFHRILPDSMMSKMRGFNEAWVTKK